MMSVENSPLPMNYNGSEIEEKELNNINPQIDEVQKESKLISDETQNLIDGEIREEKKVEKPHRRHKTRSRISNVIINNEDNFLSNEIKSSENDENTKDKAEKESIENSVQNIKVKDEPKIENKDEIVNNIISEQLETVENLPQNEQIIENESINMKELKISESITDSIQKTELEKCNENQIMLDKDCVRDMEVADLKNIVDPSTTEKKRKRHIKSRNTEVINEDRKEECNLEITNSITLGTECENLSDAQQQTRDKNYDLGTEKNTPAIKMNSLQTKNAKAARKQPVPPKFNNKIAPIDHGKILNTESKDIISGKKISDVTSVTSLDSNSFVVSPNIIKKKYNPENNKPISSSNSIAVAPMNRRRLTSNMITYQNGGQIGLSHRSPKQIPQNLSNARSGSSIVKSHFDLPEQDPDIIKRLKLLKQERKEIEKMRAARIAAEEEKIRREEYEAQQEKIRLEKERHDFLMREKEELRRKTMEKRMRDKEINERIKKNCKPIPQETKKKSIENLLRARRIDMQQEDEVRIQLNNALLDIRQRKPDYLSDMYAPEKYRNQNINSKSPYFENRIDSNIDDENNSLDDMMAKKLNLHQPFNKDNDDNENKKGYRSSKGVVVRTRPNDIMKEHKPIQIVDNYETMEKMYELYNSVVTSPKQEESNLKKDEVLIDLKNNEYNNYDVLNGYKKEYEKTPNYSEEFANDELMKLENKIELENESENKFDNEIQQNSHQNLKDNNEKKENIEYLQPIEYDDARGSSEAVPEGDYFSTNELIKSENNIEEKSSSIEKKEENNFNPRTPSPYKQEVAHKSMVVEEEKEMAMNTSNSQKQDLYEESNNDYSYSYSDNENENKPLIEQNCTKEKTKINENESKEDQIKEIQEKSLKLYGRKSRLN